MNSGFIAAMISEFIAAMSSELIAAMSPILIKATTRGGMNKSRKKYYFPIYFSTFAAIFRTRA